MVLALGCVSLLGHFTSFHAFYSQTSVLFVMQAAVESDKSKDFKFKLKPEFCLLFESINESLSLFDSSIPDMFSGKKSVLNLRRHEEAAKILPSMQSILVKSLHCECEFLM